MARRTRSLLFAATLGLVLAPAYAAELGEARVSSHIGQQLVADIELAMIEDPAARVEVRLASPEVYNGAGIAMPAVLSGVNLSVMRRDGRQFLHVTTLRPVETEHLHLYLELVDKGQRAVRLATLWLTPDPHPAPPPAPVAPVPAPAPAPAREPVRPEPPVRVAPTPVRAESRLVRPAQVRKPAPAHAEAHPAACVPQPEEVAACQALGAKNAELRTQLGRLEDRVKGLQATTGAPAAAAHAGQVAKPESKPEAKPETRPEAKPEAQPEAKQEAKPEAHVPAGPKPIHAIKPLVPRKPKEPPPEEGLPWGWIGAALALLAVAGAGALLVLRRRRGARNVDIPAAPGLLDKLKQRFAARIRRAPKGAQAPAEPTLD